MKKTLIALIAAALITAAASAQVADKKSLTLDGARQVIAAAQAEARKLNAPGGVIAVVDDGGNLIALERLDGTFAAGPTFPSARRAPPSYSSGPRASSKSSSTPTARVAR